MYEIINIDNWFTKDFSKGTREKYTVENPKTGENYLFKYPAEYDGKKNGDVWAEKIATEIGKILEIKVQESYLAIKDKEQGILIKYSLDQNSEYLEEGAISLKKLIKEFKENSTAFYTFENIKKCLEKENINIGEFIDIIFFDCVIGNTDRHCENWGILKKNRSNIANLIAAYDNGSSLGRDYHSKEEEIPNTSEEIRKYAKNAKSRIRKIDTQRISLYDFLSYVLKDYPNKKSIYLEKINFLTEIKIKEIVNEIPDDFMSLKLKNFVVKLLLERKNAIIEILKEEDKND